MLSDDRQLIETPISDETVFRGALIDVSHMQVRLPNGRTALREIVHHKGAAAIVPVDDEEYVYLVRQHRVVNDMLTWEIPAGKLDTADEDPLHCAVRELREETGLDLGGAEPELLGTTVYEEEFVDTYAVRLPFALADVRPPRRGRESAPEGRVFCARRAK